MSSLDNMVARLGQATSQAEEATAAYKGAVMNVGYKLHRSYQETVTLMQVNDAVQFSEGGVYYRWDGAFPQGGLVIPQNTPDPSPAQTGAGKYLAVLDLELRNSLSSQSRTALHTSFANAGLLLVPGSFEYGAFITSTTDIVLSTQRGTGYRYKGTIPLSGIMVPPNSVPDTNWVAVHLSAVSAIDASFFGVRTGMGFDNTELLSGAMSTCHLLGYKLRLPAGVIRTTGTIKVVLGSHYSKAGSILFGSGKASTIIHLDYDDTTSPIPIISIVGESDSQQDAYNFAFRDVGMRGAVTDATSAGIVSNIGISGIDFKSLRIEKVITAIHLKKNAWINNFVDIIMAPRDYGIRMDLSGTTNWFDQCFVYGSNVCAYRLRCGYSSIGSLAADDCIGTIYDLSFFFGTANSLGAESPNPARTPSRLVKCDNADVEIGHVRGFRTCPTDGREFYAIEPGAGHARIGTIFIDQANQSDSNLVVNGGIVKGYQGSVSIARLMTPKDGNGVNPGKLTFSNPSPAGTDIKLQYGSTTPVCISGDGKPYIGLGRRTLEGVSGISAKFPLRAQQGIYFDTAGGPNGSGIGEKFSATRDQWTPGATQGSIMIEVDPKARGCALYAVTEEGADMSSTRVARVAISERVTSKSQLPNAELWPGRRVYVAEIHKWLTYDTYGSAGWYDETGSKVT